MKPIIMSTEDVRALLDGRKTMTRTPIKHQPDKSAQFMRISCGRACFETDIDIWNMMLPCKPGDVLWVRETWGDYGGGTGYYVYRADYPHDAKGYWYEKEHINWCDLPDWRSPVTMPREAARLLLRVTDVRVERVQDITVDDAGREGFEGFHHKNPTLGNLPEIVWNFKNEWDSRNAKRGYGWDTNPFCWVIEFECVEKGVELE